MTASAARVAVLVALLAFARPAAGQVFLSALADPEFSIAPLFVSLSVSSESTPHLTIFWGIDAPPHPKQAPPPHLFLLLPFDITAPGTPQDGADDLAKYVTARNFRVTHQGAVSIVGRNRTDMGTGRPPQSLGRAPFVTFVRESADRGRSRSATLLRIPWSRHIASTDWLVGVDMAVTDLVRRKPTSWYEDVFWGPRWTASASFGDLRHSALYPLYFELRQHVVPLGKDFSMLTINLADASHLRIDQVTPATANRQPSESRRNTEQVSVPLSGDAGITPQVVRVTYTYFSGRFEWRPIVISLLFLLLGNITGPVIVPLVKPMVRRLLARVHVGAAPVRQKGVVLDPPTLARLRPGETTYDDVMRLCGPDFEDIERTHGNAAERTLRYRGQRLVPHQGWRLGRLSHVKRWDLEMHEVDIELEHDRVADVQARVRRAKWVPTQPV
jgi:hypothetical protein